MRKTISKIASLERVAATGGLNLDALLTDIAQEIKTHTDEVVTLGTEGEPDNVPAANSVEKQQILIDIILDSLLEDVGNGSDRDMFKKNSYSKPVPRSYWVVPGLFSAGEYPGSKDNSDALDKISRLIDCGIRQIINLMEPTETDHDGNLFNNYEKNILRIADSKNVSVDCKRFPVSDLSVPSSSLMKEILDTISNSIDKGKPVYIHCWGGIGRTGTVVGCFLLRKGMANPGNVLNVITDLRKHDPERNRISPETDAQRNFVINWLNEEKGNTKKLSRTVGCMLGGAVGDALGAPVEFLSLHEIQIFFGPSGITDFEEAYGRKGAITDDTQMSLFTAEGLILSKVRQEYSMNEMIIPAIYHAYLRWLYTQEIQLQNQLVQEHGTCTVVDGILTGHSELFSQRAPGNSCLSSVKSGQMGTMDHPINNSKGCGGVMRVAPIGLAFTDAEKAFRLGCESAAITHGHPTGYLSSGYLAALISRIVTGKSLNQAIIDSTRILRKYENHGECFEAVEGAVELSQNREPTPETIETLGAGWIAEEALSIGLYCALVAGDNFREGLLLAVNHSGHSDSTGSIAGNIIGSLHGIEVIPNEWLSTVELKELIEEIAVDLVDQF